MTAGPVAVAWALGGRAALALCFGLGALAALGQAPLGLWFVALPAYACIIHLVSLAATPRRAAWRGLLAGAGHFALALSWIVEPFLIDAARHGWMAPFALVLMAFGLALFWAGAAAVAGLARGRAARAVLFAATLTAAEILRGHVLTGFPWALPGHIWADTALAQGAALAGAYGLTLATLLVAALPLVRGRRGAVAAVAVVLAGLGAGAWRLALPTPPSPDPAVMLRLVQPNAEQALKWEPGLAQDHFARLLDLTRAPPPPGTASPDLVIWPETAVPYLLDRAPGALWEISEAGAGTPVATGIQRTDGGWRGWNSLAVIGPGGEVTALYDKHHLVPFGEYMPFGDLLADWFGIRAFAAQEGNGYSAGPGAAVLDLGPRLGRAVPLICYEAVFPQVLRAAPGRADWILQITNDAWFGTLTGPYQHLAQARLRAVEQGLPMARVANTGITAMIDARGQVVASLPLGARGFLDVALPAALPAPPYARWGEAPVLAVLVLVAGLALAMGRRAGA